MKVIVQKYGGSSLATPELIQRIAERVIKTKNMGYEVVVVVSALGDTTDHLLDLAKQITKHPPRRELDMLLSVGERIAIALLAMAINEKGYPAISFTGSQVGIITNTDHTRARILEIKGDRIRKELQNSKIVVVAGYQGVSVEKEITTLGRGGSDTTAVALAAALNAERCEIMSDVDGVYTANPHLVPNARCISEISYEEMLNMADMGAQVIKAAAVEFAKRNNVKIYIGSSFSGDIGTIITNRILDQNRVSGVTIDENISLITLKNGTKKSNNILIKTLAKEGVTVKFIWERGAELTLILKDDDLETAKKLINAQKKKTSEISASFNKNIGLLSVVGVGINFGTDVMAKVMNIFDEMAILPYTFQFSESQLSFGIEKNSLKKAALKIHDTLILDYEKV